MAQKPHFLNLFLLFSFASFGAVIFTPALPEMAHFFGVSMPGIRAVVLLYLLGYALGEFPYGPIGNRIGRKRGIYLGSIIGCFGCFLAVISYPVHAFWLLLVAVFFIGLGCACGFALAMAIIGDAYDQKEAAHKISSLVITFAVMPAVAVVLGGYLASYYGWWACFLANACYVLLVMFFSVFLPTTDVPQQYQKIRLNKVFLNFALQFKNAKLMISALVMAMSTAYVYFYAALAPFIGIIRLKLSPHEYGLWSLLPYLGMAISSLVAPPLLRRFSSRVVVGLSAVATFIVILTMFLCFEFGVISLFTVFGLYCILFLFMSMIISVTSIGLSSATDKANAGAVLTGVNMLPATVMTIIFSTLRVSSHMLLPASILAASLVQLVLLFLLDVIKSKEQCC